MAEDILMEIRSGRIDPTNEVRFEVKIAAKSGLEILGWFGCF